MATPVSYTPRPFVPELYQRNSRFADLLMQQGRDAADAQRRQGEISAQLWGGVGNSISNAATTYAKAKQEEPLRQLQALKVADEQRQQAGEKVLSTAMQSQPNQSSDFVGPQIPSLIKQEGDVSVWDIPALTKHLAAAGFGDKAEVLLSGAERMNAAHRSEAQAASQAQQAKANTWADGAANVVELMKLGLPIDQAITMTSPTLLANKSVQPEELQQLTSQLTAMTPEQAHGVLQQIMQRGNKPNLKLGKDDKIVSGYDPTQVIASNVVPDKPPNPTEAGFAAASVDPTKTPEERARAQAALDAMRKPTTAPALEQQLLEAISKGDTSTAARITGTMRAAAQARKDPGADAMAKQLGSLRADEARARLDALRQKAEPLDIAPDVQTTVSGHQYVDGSLYSAGERDRARKAANDAGAVFVSKEQANALQEIDNARANQSSIMTQIGDLLPKGPGGRPLAAAETALAKLFQTDEQKAAFASWRTAAIQTLRATAGSKGLRINQAEIAQAIENDIPKLTDSLGTAKQKVSNINTMLDNAEKSIVVRDRTPQTSALGAGTTQTVEQGGVRYKVTTDASGKVISSEVVR